MVDGVADRGLERSCVSDDTNSIGPFEGGDVLPLPAGLGELMRSKSTTPSPCPEEARRNSCDPSSLQVASSSAIESDRVRLPCTGASAPEQAAEQLSESESNAPRHRFRATAVLISRADVRNEIHAAGVAPHLNDRLSSSAPAPLSVWPVEGTTGSSARPHVDPCAPFSLPITLRHLHT